MKVLPYRSEYDDQDDRPTRFAIFRMFVYCIGLGLVLLTMLVLAIRISAGNILRGDWLSLIILFPISLFGWMLYIAFMSLRRMLERRARYPFEE